MSEELIVDFASPTLAGIKTGSLFSGECGGKEELSEFAARMNRRLTPHGLRLMPLRFNEKRALMYIYRPEKLREDLDDPLAKEILGALGYPLESGGRCIAKLAKRVRENKTFPHEIGLFLGYPSEDVKGFISGEKPKCTGMWKVYGDIDSAKSKFDAYRNCTRIMREYYRRTKSMDKLIMGCS